MESCAVLAKDRLDQPRGDAGTVDPAEITRFAALAEEWWNPNGKFKAIHAFNPVRRDFIIEQLVHSFGRDTADRQALAGLKVLDVGCGAGLLCEPLAARGADVIGIDAAGRNVEIARRHASQSGLAIDYRHCLAEHLIETSQRFDVVLNTEVVEHVADPRRLLQQCADLLKPGGLMIVATLNRTARAYLLAIIGAEYVLHWLPRGTHDWGRFLKPDEVLAMIEPHELKMIDTVGLSYNPIAARWRISRDTGVNYMLIATKGAG
jgi:2-polyprenyl-6-hydroxyphenyl methylase/3-demethylubiquinone-9 3-methyltransferase